MKIKHFTGYGSVNAVKVSKKNVTDTFGNEKVELVVRVSGNHEWGLERNDAYDLYNWLIKRFDKSIGDFYDIYGGLSYTMNDYYIKENGLDVECCDYKFTYPKK